MRQSTTQRVKLMLLDGRSLTVAHLDDLLRTNNSAQVINRLRKSGFKVTTTWKVNADTGKRYGVYTHEKKRNESRIKSQEYRNRV